jgi:plastocyanin
MGLRVLLAGAAIVVAASGCGGGDADAVEAADSTFTIEAGDLYFDPEELVADAGELTFTVDNVGSVEHDLVIEEAGDAHVVHVDAGETATGSITLDPGTYTFYCSIPGHRSTMEGTLEVR